MRKQAGLLTFEEENRLWELGILSTETPLSLLNAVFVLNGINPVAQEHHGLKSSQFTFGTREDPDDPASKLAFSM